MLRTECIVLLDKLPDSVSANNSSQRKVGRYTLRKKPADILSRSSNKSTANRENCVVPLKKILKNSAKRVQSIESIQKISSDSEKQPAKRKKRTNSIDYDRENLEIRERPLDGTESACEQISNAVAVNQDLLKKIFNINTLLLQNKDEQISLQKLYYDDCRKSVEQDTEIKHLKEQLKKLQEKAIDGDLIDFNDGAEQTHESDKGNLRKKYI